jgi:extradiol dioxygenase family protein
MNPEFIFHLAIPINDMEQAKAFYCDGLACSVGRENAQALILNFYGHQLVAHKTEETLKPQKGIYPRHFGLIFAHKSDWEEILSRSQAQNLTFYEQPKLRFPHQLIEHNTFFLEDPFYNLLEFKFYRHREAIFGGREFKKIGDRLETQNHPYSNFA